MRARRVLPLLGLCAGLLSMPAVSRAQFLPAEPAAAPATIETVVSGPNAVTVYWSPPSGGGWQSYRVLREDQPIATPDHDARKYADSGLVPGRAYHYRVEAVYPDGRQVASHTIVEKLPPTPQRESHYDVVVVQASSAGMSAAVTAARKGFHVALLEPTDRLGGIMSNGLCSTDIRRPYHATGFFEEFRQRVQQYYGSGEGLRYEPHVVNNIYKEIVGAEPLIDVYYHVRPTGVKLDGARVTGVTAQSLDTGQKLTFDAPITIDADPTGDVTAWAGCRCRVGREPRSKEEPHAGVIYYDRAHDLLLPGSTGKGDRRLMAYTYLVVVKDFGPGTDHRIPMPPGYKESEYIHSPEWKKSWAVTDGAMPGGKYELNQHPQGGDLQAVNYRWPWENPQQRAVTEQIYRNHGLGYVYYIQTHFNLPNLGLPDDEFPENGGFPETLYVREARRVVGMANLDEADVYRAGERLRPDSTGIGDYPMDSHAVRPKTDWDRPDMGEGEWWLYRYTPWYQIPIGVVIPQDRDGLLVAEAVSATHVGYGTLRMEPVRMETGELCGQLAAISEWTNTQPRMLPPNMVQDWLTTEGQRIYWHSDVDEKSPNAPAIEFLSSHGFWPGAEFKPDDPVTRGEAFLALRALQWMEAAQASSPVLRQVVSRSQWHSPSDPTSPLTRGVLAQWLVQTEATLRPGAWSAPPDTAGADLPYPDLVSGTPTRDAALLLWQHHIVVDGWKDTPHGDNGRPLFGADLPVTRGDFAQALYLAQRAFPTPFFHPTHAIVQLTPQFPPRTP